MHIGFHLKSAKKDPLDTGAPIYKVSIADRPGIFIDGKELNGVKTYDMHVKGESSDVGWSELSVTLLVEADT